jgi:pyruvate-ferredoxin/flavodoxin oxidoreductase
MAMAYGNIYVAQVALGAKDAQTLKALQEAEAYPGPSLVIAYSPCIAHGFEMSCALDHEKAAVDSGYWPLYRFDPRRADAGLPALTIDSPAPKSDVAQFMAGETRFRVTDARDHERYEELVTHLRDQITHRLERYKELSTKH